LEDAKEEGDKELMDKFSRRTVKATREHNDECKRLLRLMGIPYVEAPCEAEAQCAALVRAGKVYAAGSEDMDTLTFGAPILLRHLTFSETRKLPIDEYCLDKVLTCLELTMDQFTDLCILLGCDYCESIRGIGPHRAFRLIKEYGSIEDILKNLDKEKYPMPENWAYENARSLFKEAEVLDPANIELKWGEPDEEKIIEFLVKEKGFNEQRVKNGIEKLRKSLASSQQSRLDGFFKMMPASAAKRQSENGQTANSKKKKTMAKSGRGKPRR